MDTKLMPFIVNKWVSNIKLSDDKLFISTPHKTKNKADCDVANLVLKDLEKLEIIINPITDKYIILGILILILNILKLIENYIRMII